MAEIMQYEQSLSPQRILSPIIRIGNNLVVVLYKLAGFAVLFAILAALVSYLSIHLFFFFDTRWVAPTILSVGDEQVLRIESEISEQELAKDRIVGEQIQMTTLLHNLEQHRMLQHSVHQGIQNAIRGGKVDHIRARNTLTSALATLQTVSPDIKVANTEYAKQLKTNTEQLAAAHLITQDEITERKQQINRIAIQTATVLEQNADLTNRIRMLERESDSLDTAGAAARPADSDLTFNVMQLKVQMDNASLLQIQDSKNEGELVNRVRLQEDTVKRIDTMLASLYSSPYLNAALQGQVLAFVPYDHLHNVWPTQRLYACRLTIVWCSAVGSIAAVLPGEVQGKDPVTQRPKRGLFVRLKLDRKDAAQQQVLYLGNKPLWF